MSDTLKKPNTIPAAIAAIRTLEHLGYTYTEGTELWRPPLGPRRTDPSLMSKLGQQAMNGDFWVYQGDGEDHLESLTTAVVIDPRRLRGIVENCNTYGVALQKIGSALDIMPGSDIGEASLKAIFALKVARHRGDSLARSRAIAVGLIVDILNSLPANKDWLDPATERAMRDAVKPVDPPGSYRDATGELVLPVNHTLADAGGV